MLNYLIKLFVEETNDNLSSLHLLPDIGIFFSYKQHFYKDCLIYKYQYKIYFLSQSVAVIDYHEIRGTYLAKNVDCYPKKIKCIRDVP